VRANHNLRGLHSYRLLKYWRARQILLQEEDFRLGRDEFRKLIGSQQSQFNFDLIPVITTEGRRIPVITTEAIVTEERRWRALEPRPAPFDYRVVDEKIDVAPETARSIDAETSRDLQAECLRKARAVAERLQRSQADDGVRLDVEMLLERLGSETLRPGLILSSLRSLEAIDRAYDTAAGREELYPDALKNIFDLTRTLRELAATFPNSREIEAEAVSLALPLERLAEIEQPIARAAVAIDASDAATLAAKESLATTAAAIGTSRDLADRAKQVAYHLLDLGNIARAGLRHLKTTGQRIATPVAQKATHEIGGLAADTWKAFRKDFPKRAARSASIAVTGGIGALLHVIGPELAALATLVAAFGPVSQATKELQEPTGEDHGGRDESQTGDKQKKRRK
jgi:hypothetical protein